MGLKSAWNAIPEGAAKNWARVAFHNYQQRGRVHFRVSNGCYVATAKDYSVITTHPPYGDVKSLELLEHRHRVLPGEVVIDAGAYCGTMALIFAAQVGPHGRVIAFEPDSINRERLLRNLELNGNPAQLEIVEEGLWDQRTEIEFCQRGALGSSAFWDGPGGSKVRIRTTTLDEVVFARNVPRVDFIKFNIEGAELKALQGATETIRKFRPRFAISSDHFVDGNFAAGERTWRTVEQVLRAQGYAVETIQYGTSPIALVTYGTPPAR